MAVLFFDGCGEFYDSAHITDAWDTASGGTVNPTGGRRNAAALELGQNEVVSKSVPAPADDTLIFGFAFKKPSQDDRLLARFSLGIQPQVNLDTTSSGEIRIERDGVLLHTTAANTYLTDTWHYCECKVKVADSPDGFVVLCIDETEVANITGQDTLAGTTAGIDRLTFGFGIGPALQGTFDDVYIADLTGLAPQNDFLGDIQVDAVQPDSNGSVNDFTPSAGANWQNVDENPTDDDTTYNETTTTTNVDLYSFTNLPAVGAASVVHAVDVRAKSRRVDGAFTNMQLVARPVATQFVSGNKPQSVDYTPHQNIWQTNPEGGSWSDTSINNSQFGVKLV